MKGELITEKKTEIIPQIKLFQESYSSKEIQSPNSSTFYNVNTLNRKSTFKISEKDCSDINSIVKNSVEKINDLLNSQEFNNNKKDQKEKTEKEKTMKTNFTFNINNFINVPNNNKNENLNIVNKKERYDDYDDDFWINNNENNTNNKVKSNQKRNNNNINDKIKNRNINYGTSLHNNIHNSNNEKIFKNSVKKKKLFDDGINIQYNNNINNNNVNIVNFTNNHKKKQKNQNDNEKDKSITVNTRYKKFNSGDDYLNIKGNNQNKISLNHSIKNKNEEKKIYVNNLNNNNILKFSVSDEINSENNTKQKKKFTPNIININSLSGHRNIKNFIFNNNKLISNNNSIKENNNNDNNKAKNKKQKNKKYYKSQGSNNKNYKNIKDNNYQDNCKAFLFTDEKNNFNKNKSNNNIFTKSYSNQMNEKYNSIHDFQIENNIYNDVNELRPSINKTLKKENTTAIIKNKCGYSCDHRNSTNYYSHYSNQNIHKILNKIYYKEFPTKIRTNTIMKLMLFMNEYLISNNLLDDYYDRNNQKKLDSLSKFISDQFNVDFPQQDDVNIDKMINSIKKIQRMWRKKKMEKYFLKNNKKEENELKKMVLNKYIKKAGFKIKKIIGLFNSMVECFDLIGNEKEMEEMFYNVQQVIKRKLTPYEKNLLYKEYINKIIYEN